jgi:hypothetical protein
MVKTKGSNPKEQYYNNQKIINKRKISKIRKILNI